MGNGFKDRVLEYILPGVFLLFAITGITVSLVYPASPVGRFQIVAPGSNAAYDTVTGRMCWLYDPIGQGSEKIPLCKDIYDGR